MLGMLGACFAETNLDLLNKAPLDVTYTAACAFSLSRLTATAPSRREPFGRFPCCNTD